MRFFIVLLMTAAVLRAADLKLKTSDTPPPAAQGEPCTGQLSYQNCQDGLYCKPSAPGSREGTCQPQVSDGTCDMVYACAAPMLCGGTGNCFLPIAEGSPCDPAGFPACDRIDNFCADDGICRKRLRTGEACVGPNDCVTWAWCSGGICQELPGEGEPCAGPEGTRCIGNIACTDGMCQKPNPGLPPCTSPG